MKGAIAIIGYNRPTYFQSMLDSFCLNRESLYMHTYFCLDGGGKAKEYRDIINQKTAVLPKQPNWDVIEQKKNLGVAHHLFSVREKLLIDKQYDYVIVIEDDVVCSPYMLRITNQLLIWTEKNYDNVAVVSPWSINFMTEDQKKHHLKDVLTTNDNWIVYAMTDWGWYAIRDNIKNYLDEFIRQGKYKQRNDKQIRDWFKEILKIKKETQSPFLDKYEFDLSRISKFPTSQDAVIALSLYSEGLVKVKTKVNRCLYIGEIGEHGTKENFKRFENITLDIFEEDKTITEFNPIINRKKE